MDQLLAGLPLLGAGENGIAHLRQADGPVADIGREPGNRAAEEVAGLGVALGLDLAQESIRMAASALDRAEAAAGLGEELLQRALECTAVAELAGEVTGVLLPVHGHSVWGWAGQRLRLGGQ